MKLSNAVAFSLVSLPGAMAWGGLGHITTAYIASNFVSNSTEAYLKQLLRSNESDYMAKVASWADSIRYTKWGRFTSTFHFIDAHDNPPESCNVDFERDSTTASIAEKLIGRGKPYLVAQKWSAALTEKIVGGAYADEKEAWLADLDFGNFEATALAWSRECNSLVCGYVFPEGPKAIVGQELSGEYYEKAAPILEKQVARAGYRMAAWLDRIVDEYKKREANYTGVLPTDDYAEEPSDELDLELLDETEKPFVGEL
ncbi:phospholipase C/P1 nuclease [Trichoderma longibrachiatum ATCC 18648]|uniref:Phospholipase C/P1 nuclease n=1 Tax=Trichoderma longibrachiatum ATCC 18648 TaxID=983965 RepID=A0A2T4BWB9_TRILO|nr:phospholipase C/P1 nuclease [Trichoderma longibrachiatum ATCC 18648]